MGHHKCLSSNDSSLLSSREIVARNNVKHGALNNRRDRNRSHSHSSHAVSRSRSNVGRSNREANVLRRRLGFNRSHNRSTNVHRKRSSNSSLSRNSKSRSAVILERAKARSHKTVTTDNTD